MDFVTCYFFSWGHWWTGSSSCIRKLGWWWLWAGLDQIRLNQISTWPWQFVKFEADFQFLGERYLNDWKAIELLSISYWTQDVLHLVFAGDATRVVWWARGTGQQDYYPGCRVHSWFLVVLSENGSLWWIKHSDMTYSHDTTRIWIVYSNLFFCRYNNIHHCWLV